MRFWHYFGTKHPFEKVSATLVPKLCLERSDFSLISVLNRKGLDIKTSELLDSPRFV